MAIDKKLILKLEDLAMLQLSEEEKEEVRKDLNEILAMITKLEEYDTASTKPLNHLTEIENVMRKDIPKKHLERQDGLKNAKLNDGKYIIVPKIIK